MILALWTLALLAPLTFRPPPAGALLAPFTFRWPADNTEVTYVETDTTQLSISTGTSEIEVADAVIATLAGLLDVHPKDVIITSVNMETGEVQCEVASPDALLAPFRFRTPPGLTL